MRKRAEKEVNCYKLFDCCDCGGHNCECPECFSCNACENCKEYNEGEKDCFNKDWND